PRPAGADVFHLTRPAGAQDIEQRPEARRVRLHHVSEAGGGERLPLELATALLGLGTRLGVPGEAALDISEPGFKHGTTLGEARHAYLEIPPEHDDLGPALLEASPRVVRVAEAPGCGHRGLLQLRQPRLQLVSFGVRPIERFGDHVTVAGRLGDVLGRALDLGRRPAAGGLEHVRSAGDVIDTPAELVCLQRRLRGDRLGFGQFGQGGVELELAESSVRREAAQEAARRELGCTPEEAMGAPLPELPEGQDAATRAATVEAELASLGPVNPLALEELGELEERHRFLEEQVEDVRRARRELHQVIRAVDDEIMRVFAEAFADVNEHFRVLVEALFPGGSGRLSLTEPEDLLNTGVEVEARPAGKNVRKLSLLSGGERSLVALAFLFAVFRSRPSPFYLLDEVEAALDDVNLHRFLDLLHEFREEAQLIIVSHQKRTMEAADALYGVTMTPGGSSKVVSQKVGREPESERPVIASPA
ncbi:MAG TPA: AAA family ATPase, partial [Candidatus Binatus sp.]|nr:AAA family ATPase [Candidatus Binatus sp.]